MQTGPKFKRNETAITKERKKTLAPFLFKWEDERQVKERENNRINKQKKRKSKGGSIEEECKCSIGNEVLNKEQFPLNDFNQNITATSSVAPSLDLTSTMAPLLPSSIVSSSPSEKGRSSLVSIPSTELTEVLESEGKMQNIYEENISDKFFHLVNSSNFELFKIKEQLKIENEELKKQVEFWKNKYFETFTNQISDFDNYLMTAQTETTETTRTEITKRVISPVTSPSKQWSPQFKAHKNNPSSSPVKQNISRKLFSEPNDDLPMPKMNPNINPLLLRKGQ
jgi:hypothetical protein